MSIWPYAHILLQAEELYEQAHAHVLLFHDRLVHGPQIMDIMDGVTQSLLSCHLAPLHSDGVRVVVAVVVVNDNNNIQKKR